MHQKTVSFKGVTLLSVVLMSLLGCSPTQKNAVSATTTPATTPAATPAATTPQAPNEFAGLWKITAFTIVEAPAELSPETRKFFESKMIEIGTIEINADSTYTMQAVEAANTGSWKAEGNTLTFINTTGEVDILKINSNKNNTLTGRLTTGESVKVDIELKRTLK